MNPLLEIAKNLRAIALELEGIAQPQVPVAVKGIEAFKLAKRHVDAGEPQSELRRLIGSTTGQKYYYLVLLSIRYPKMDFNGFTKWDRVSSKKVMKLYNDIAPEIDVLNYFHSL